MDRSIRIGVYKILRKLGAKREEIDPDVKLQNLLEYYADDWNILLFFLESKFDIFISQDQEQAIVTVEDTIEIVHSNLNKSINFVPNVLQSKLMLA